MTALLLCAVASPAGLAAAQGADDQHALTTRALEQYNSLSDMRLPMPSPEEIEEIVAGKVVKLRKRMDMPSAQTNETRQRIRVVGYRLIERPRLLVWLAALDVGTEHTDRLTEHLVSTNSEGGSVWYQHLRLVWPLRDRHWVIQNGKTVELANATGGLVWEHGWKLAPAGREIAAGLLQENRVDGLSGKRARRAIYLPANRGAWTMFALGERLTLVATHATVDLGGFIPDSFVASYVGSQLESMLNGLVPRSDVMDTEYTTSFTIYTGAGDIVTVRMAEQAMKLEKAMKAKSGVLSAPE